MDDAKKCVGMRIESVFLENDKAVVTFEHGAKLVFEDKADGCCEHRYMTLDGDDTSYFKGALWVGAEVLSAPSRDDGGDCHDVEFLVFRTTKGVITFYSHNEHNGNYGGFDVRAVLS